MIPFGGVADSPQPRLEKAHGKPGEQRVVVRTIAEGSGLCLLCLRDTPRQRCFLSFPSCSSPHPHLATITGTVIGTVTDQSGAVIAGAAVTATNMTTGVATRSFANGQGLYSIRFLPIGPYTIAVTAVGFTTTSVGPFNLEIDQIAKIDLNLHIGNASTTVHVASDVYPICERQPLWNPPSDPVPWPPCP